jgi:ATP-dependent Clp protease ATP-binding subunit ClpC
MEYTEKLEAILTRARAKTIEFGLPQVSTEAVLLAIIEDRENDGYAKIEEYGGNMGKLRSSVMERLRAVQKEPTYVTAVPRLSAQMRFALNFAMLIALDKPLTVEHVVLGLYRNTDGVASRLLVESGFSEPGEQKRRQMSGHAINVGTPAVNAFSTDLTVLAQEGKLDPVIGRDLEISRLVEILARRKKNNPALIGEPGVGKTAIVEGLALRIAAGVVPEFLLNKRIVSLDLNSIVAGTQFRGQFEQRMQAIIKELSKSPDIIVFIDEMHTLMGSGGTEGTGDAANIIKPALSRGQVRVIGATTLKEYRRHIEKDGALERRFQKVQIEQPTLEETVKIIEQVKGIYELFHGVKYAEGLGKIIVDLAERYVQDRFFPDKALDVLDEVGALAKITPDTPIVGADKVRQVISKQTGVPIADLTKGERERLQRIEVDLGVHLVGQPAAIKAVATAIKRKRTGVKSDKRPSTFLFIGPTGVGKTEMARQLAKYLFDSESAMIRLDMSEFFDHFTVSSLIGAPPGYVGYEDGGGKLTEKVRKKPYSIILLDEIEKAHPSIFNVLLQIFDDGVLTDSQGRLISFKNTIVILTSNIGVDKAGKRSLGFNEATANEDMERNLQVSLKQHFRPEFLNRLDGVVTFHRLTKEDMAKIFKLMLDDINEKFKVVVSEEALVWFLEKGYSPEYGARPLRRLIEKEIETRMADELLIYPEATEFEITLENNEPKISTKQGQ